MKKLVNSPWFWRFYICFLPATALVMEIKNWTFPHVFAKICWIICILTVWFNAKNIGHWTRADKRCWLVLAPSLLLGIWIRNDWAYLFLALAFIALVAWLWNNYLWMRRAKEQNIQDMQKFNDLVAKLPKKDSK